MCGNISAPEEKNKLNIGTRKLTNSKKVMQGTKVSTCLTLTYPKTVGIFLSPSSICVRSYNRNGKADKVITTVLWQGPKKTIQSTWQLQSGIDIKFQ